MKTKLLVIGMLDDTDAGIVFMEELVEAVLRQMGVDKASVDLKRSSDRREAEAIAASAACDLLLMDLVWPVEGGPSWRIGLDLAQTAKSANSRTVVVVITGKQDEERNFRTDAKARMADFAFTWREAFGEGKVLAAKEVAHALAPAMSALVPEIASVSSSTVGLVGLDTVAYSEEDDATQVGVVKSFLAYTRECWEDLATPSVRPVFVFTGDGLILGLVGDLGPRLALDLAVAVWRRLEKLAGYKTRLAVHAGPTSIATLTSGSQQLLGHSVNWLCRAIDTASQGGLVVTEEYFTSVLQAGRETVPGLRFTRREDAAKHGRPLIVHDVTRS